MTLGLRKAHGRAAVGLVLAVPALLAISVAARRPIPGPPRAAAAASAAEAPVPFVVLAPRIEARIVPESGERFVLEVRAVAPPQIPDLLVYWASAHSTADGSPEDATLLGSVATQGVGRFPLPAPSAGARGAVLLYSLARQERVATLPLSGAAER